MPDGERDWDWTYWTREFSTVSDDTDGVQRIKQVTNDLAGLISDYENGRIDDFTIVLEVDEIDRGNDA